MQCTCLSYEAIHDIQELLKERGNPKEGYLFVSQTRTKDNNKNSGLDVRSIHDAMKNLSEKSLSPETAREFKTKLFRSFYNSTLLNGEIVQEIKDLMMGHKRLGSKGNYTFDKQTIISAYNKTFELRTINGIQAKADIQKLKDEFAKKEECHTLETNALKNILT